MKGDFTRDTFDPRKHFSRILMQQGRVQLDADWNEQTAILLHYLRTLAKDVLGPSAGPLGRDLGFEIITEGTPGLDAKLLDIEPDDETRRRALKDAIAQGDMLISPGRYYVDGILVENERAILYTEQLGYPFNDLTKLDALEGWDSGLLFYLDVWERHITYVEDDRVREVALGGPDTCSRAQVVWQLKARLDRDVPVGFNCTEVSEWLSQWPSLGTGKLRARARLDKPPTELCVIPPESRYRGAENQLYRVEVHRGGAATGGSDSATFKWSRENGAVTFPIRTLTGTTAALESLGRDLHLSLNLGDWVEVVDDGIAVGETAGPLAQVDTVNRDDLSVRLTPAVGTSPLGSYGEADVESKHPLLRRWDHQADPKVFGGALQITEQEDSDDGVKAGWIDLEDSVQVWFAKDGEYRVGDYWIIPARVATGDIEWPDELDSSGNRKLSDGNPIGAALAPHGPQHHYTPILLVTSPGNTASDCRCPINHLPCVTPNQQPTVPVRRSRKRRGVSRR
jgi:hypothetical protein